MSSYRCFLDEALEIGYDVSTNQDWEIAGGGASLEARQIVSSVLSVFFLRCLQDTEGAVRAGRNRGTWERGHGGMPLGAGKWPVRPWTCIKFLQRVLLREEKRAKNRPLRNTPI